MYASNIARTRYSGLASGVDIDSLVQVSLQTYYNKIDTATKQKTLTEWKKDAYREMNTKLTDFKYKYFSYSSPSTTLKSSESMNAKTVSLTENSNVKVTATSLADIDSHKITDVTVATKATASSDKLYIESGTISGKTLSEVSQMFKDQGGTFAEADANGNYKVTLNVNGKEVEKTFSADTTISSFLSEINNSGIDGKLSFNELSRRFELKTNETGANQKVSISGAMFGSGVVAEGTNASVTIDGEKHESASNTFAVGGLKFETLANGSDLNINATVKKDTDSVFNRIKAFVDDYNALVSDINSKVAERKSSSYLPLTDDEKADMKEADIEEWTKKAKQGMFYNDRTLSSLVSGMRSIFSQSDVAGTGKTLASIGIKTGSYETKGQIVLDEAKLKAALENDSESVAQMFTGKGGIAETFANRLDTAVDAIRDVTISGFTKSISSYTKKIDELYDVLEQKEDALYDRYATMESTIAKLQSQMNSLGF